MEIQQVILKGDEIIPPFELPNETGIIGIQTNVQRKNLLLKQFLKKENTYVALTSDGEYPRLKVKELLQFFKGVFEATMTVNELLHLFKLHDVEQMKVKDLPVNKKMLLSNVRVYLAPQSIIMLEEPFFHLENAERRIFKDLLNTISANKQIIILSSNLEDVLICCDTIYRLDDHGFHLLDIADEEKHEEEQVNSESFKIQKIQTKKDGKIILFNPPEIDYIESVNSTIVVHVGGDTYVCALTLNELEKRLQHYGFFRCHRSYIVNLQKVREMITWTKNSYSLRLNVGKDSVVPLSRTKLAELKDLLNI